MSGIAQILESGKAPGFKPTWTPWRQFVSTIHDGDTRGASKIYGRNPEGVLASKPQYDDLAKEN